MVKRLNGSNRNGSGRDSLDRLNDLDQRFRDVRRQRQDTAPASSYSAGESSRLSPVPRGIDPLGSDADYHYRTERNYFLMVERSRAAVRNHPLVEQGIKRLIANLRLVGIAIDVDSGDQAANDYLKTKWKTWCASPEQVDWEKKRNFDQLMCQAFFSQVVDGDLLQVPLSTGQLQTWESHHIRNPFGHRPTGSDQNGIVHGAEIQNGQVVAYHVTPFVIALGQTVRRSQSHRYEVDDDQGNQQVFWDGFTHRFNQRRGISRLSPPRESMAGFDDLNYAHIKSALRRSLISYMMESQQRMDGAPSFDDEPIPEAGDRYDEEVGLGLSAITIEQSGEAAQVFKTPRGYTMKGWNAPIPTPQFFEQAALMLTCLSVNLDLPLSALLLDGSLVNFHGGRMTHDQMKLRLQDVQGDFICQRHWPVFQWKLRQWLTPGSDHFDPALAAFEAAGANLLNVSFRPKGWPYVKPLEDAAAEDLAERRNLRSLRSIHGDHGDDFDVLMPSIIRDRGSTVRWSLDEAILIAEDPKYAKYDLNVPRLASELRYGSGDQTGVQLTLDAGDESQASVSTGTTPNEGGDDDVNE